MIEQTLTTVLPILYYFREFKYCLTGCSLNAACDTISNFYNKTKMLTRRYNYRMNKNNKGIIEVKMALLILFNLSSAHVSPAFELVTRAIV